MKASSVLEEEFLLAWKAYAPPYLGEPTRQYRPFPHPAPKWVVDFAFVKQRLAVEIEGGLHKGQRGGHTSAKGYQNNLEKYNALTLAGWGILRYSEDWLHGNLTTPRPRTPELMINEIVTYLTK